MSEEKNLEPTQRHRQKMREQGETALSRDLASASALLAGMLLFWGVGSFLADVPIQATEELWGGKPWVSASAEDFLRAWNILTGRALLFLMPILALAPLTTALVSLVQTRFLFLPSRLKLHWKQLNPTEGMTRIFSLDSVAAVTFGLAKIALASTFILWVIVTQIPAICALCRLDFVVAATKMQTLVLGTGLRIATALFLLALADYGWQYYRHLQRLKMTFEEMKEEIRITEGDASVKQRMRRR